MTTFDGWNARVAGNGGAGMVCRDAPGWVMTYKHSMTHGGSFGRGHYRGNHEVMQLYGSRGHAQKMPTQGIIGATGMDGGVVLKHEGYGATISGFEWNQGNALMHFRTKGSKNGVRRFQTEDGTWTPLGLKERRAREGFGEGRAARKEARAQRREARSAARAAERSRRAEALRKLNAEQAEARRKRNPKNLTDEELRSGIERLKMEQEYRELNQNPLLKTAKSAIKSYTDAKAAKERAEQNKYNAETNRIRALADLTKAKAENRKSKSDLVDSITGTSRKKAKSELMKQKNETRKHTVGGAIQQSVHDILSKEGNRLVKEMGDQSIVMRGGRKIKSVGSSAIAKSKAKVESILNNYKYGHNINSGSGPALN